MHSGLLGKVEDHATRGLLAHRNVILSPLDLISLVSQAAVSTTKQVSTNPD